MRHPAYSVRYSVVRPAYNDTNYSVRVTLLPSSTALTTWTCTRHKTSSQWSIKPSKTNLFFFFHILYKFCSHLTEVKSLSVIKTNVSLHTEVTDMYSDNRKINMSTLWYKGRVIEGWLRGCGWPWKGAGFATSGNFASVSRSIRKLQDNNNVRCFHYG